MGEYGEERENRYNVFLGLNKFLCRILGHKWIYINAVEGPRYYWNGGYCKCKRCPAILWSAGYKN